VYKSRVTDSSDEAALVRLQRAINDLAMDMENFDKSPDSEHRARDLFDQGCGVIDAAKALLATSGTGVDPTLRGATLDRGWSALAAADVRLRDRGFGELADEFAQRVPRHGF
jgi:hypothetical protein